MGKAWKACVFQEKTVIRGGHNSKEWPLHTRQILTHENKEETFVLVNERDDWLHHNIWDKSRRTRNFKRKTPFNAITDAIHAALESMRSDTVEANPVLMGMDAASFLDGGLPDIFDEDEGGTPAKKKTEKTKKKEADYLRKDVSLVVTLPHLKASDAPVLVGVWSEGKHRFRQNQHSRGFSEWIRKDHLGVFLKYVDDAEKDDAPDADTLVDDDYPRIVWNLAQQIWSLKVLVDGEPKEFEAKVWPTSFTNVLDGPKREIVLDHLSYLAKKRHAGLKLISKIERDIGMTPHDKAALCDCVKKAAPCSC